MTVRPALILLLLVAPPLSLRSAAQTAKSPAQSADESGPSEPSGQQLPRKLYSGRVVLLGEALKRRNIPANEEIDDQAVLETPDGELIPIVPDWRGRALFQDERLRNRPVELVGVRHPGVPYLQVLTIFTFDEKGARQYTDYWCDICAIPMYEIKPCNCCQGPIRLRFQPRDLPDYLTPQKPN